MEVSKVKYYIDNMLIYGKNCFLSYTKSNFGYKVSKF